MILRSVKKFGRNIITFAKAPSAAKIESLKDLKGLPAGDPGPSKSINIAIKWLETAQDKSTTNDGGVARHYSCLKGWGPSYPETTEYIIPNDYKACQRA